MAPSNSVVGEKKSPKKQKGTSGRQGTPIVGIGASAGGLEAFKSLLECLPLDTGLSFVVIQHLAPGQESMLTDILSRFTKMPVQTVKDKMPVEPDRVYVIPPGTTMTMENKTLNLNPKVKSMKPIDTFFVSLAEDSKNQSIGIVLSGTGSDGTEGLKAIKAQGGITFAQTPNSAQYSDMPQNAISAEAADFVLSPDKIAHELRKIAMNPQLARSEIAAKEGTGSKDAKPKKETALNAIFTMLKSKFNVDFSHFKETVVNRRVARRMVITHINKMATYADYLRSHPNELEALYNDMLIGVTSFFREPETFAALIETVFPQLVKSRQPKEPIRIWIPACSTGEEAYSFAIAIQEYLEENSIKNIQVQIFGTDVNEKNIEKARQGIYQKTIETDVPETRLKHFFTSFNGNGNYQITRTIRDMCVFAKQDITADPPFSNMDLVSCRNMLIYFDESLHEKVVPILHYALKVGGFLILGQSESIGKFTHLFEPVNKKGAIYAKKRAQPSITFGLQASAPYLKRQEGKEVDRKDALAVLKDEVDRLLVSEYVPAALLVNANLDVLVFRGNIAPYVLPESRLASLNLAKIIRKDLRSEVQTIIYRAKKEGKPVKENAVRFEYAGEQKTINIQVVPLHVEQYEAPFFLLLFEDVSSAAALLRQTMELNITPEGRENVKDRQNRELREELDSTKLTLQRITETQEATNEELRTTMEEAQSSNEELQSTNEELETAKEELQSSNEELKTLNDEVKNRNQTLAQLNDDLTNLNRNVDPAIVIIDKSLKVRLFSPSAQKILNLSPSTVGLPITSLKLGVIVEDLGETVSNVISKLSGVTKEVKDEQDHYYEMRVQPYITQEDKIGGAVLAFSDITQRKTRNEKELERLAKFPSENPNPVFRVDDKGTILYGNTAGDSLLTVWNSKVGNNAPEQISHVVEEALASKKKIEIEKTFGSKRFSFLFVPITGENYVNIYVNDITERKKAEEALKDSGARLQHALEAGELGLWGLDVITGKAWRTLQHDKIFGYNSSLPEWTYQMFLSHVLPEDRAMVDEKFGGAISKGTEWNFECRIQRHDGQQRWIWAQGKPKFDEKHAVVQMIGLVKDINERKKTEEALNKLNEELEEKVLKRTKEVSAERQRLYNVLETLPAYVILLDKDYCVPFANKVFRERFGESHGRRCYDFLFKRESPCENCETYKVLKTNGPHRWEWTGPDGRDYDIYDFPFVEADGSTLILEMGIDITERKRAEKQIRDASLYSRSLLEASLDPLVTISAEGKITDVNQATELATGCSRAELIGSDFSDYFTEPEKAKLGYKRVFNEGFVRDYPLAIKHKSGKIIDVLYNATIYTNEAGEMQGVFAAARDITELKKAEEQAQESAKKLKDAERLAAIGATAGMVGHDIRNPLQAITGDLYLAKTELAALPENEQKISALENLEEIEHNIDYINKIVADLQDYARPLSPRTQETDVESVFNEVLSKNGVPENIIVSVDIEDKAKKIVADPDYIKRIAANLTLNAVQAMPDGGKLTIRAYSDKQTNGVLITVKDTGIGIPEDIKPKLFTPMVTTKSKGQGFGLAVVKRMTEGLGGTVTFESTEGKGTTFIVRIPHPKK